MKYLIIIPARGGSKGVPGKNIKKLHGIPLIAFTINIAKKLQIPSKILISTDNKEIATVAEEFGCNVPFLRPSNLATDTSPSIDFVLHALTKLEEQNENFDAVILLQPTTPFRRKEEVEKAIYKFENTNCDSLISVNRVPHQFNPHWTFEDKNGFLEISTGEDNLITRRQDLPNAYYRNGSIYITKTWILKDRHSFIGSKLSYIETGEEWNINIDTMKDWDMAEEIAPEYLKEVYFNCN